MKWLKWCIVVLLWSTLALAAELAPNPKFTALDSNGDPWVGAKLYTYETGTTTPKATYTDSTESTPNTNPVVLDQYGQASVWLSRLGTPYRFKLVSPDNVTIWTVENVGYKVGNYLSEWGGDLEKAVDFIGDSDTTLIIDQTPNNLTDNLTIPSNLSLNWEQGCELSGSYTLTINGSIQAGNYQIFGDDITIAGLPDANSAWFGNAFSRAFSSGRAMKINSGSFQVLLPIGGGYSNRWVVSGSGGNLTKLNQNGSKVFDFSNYSYITHKTFYGLLDKFTIIGDGLTAEPLIHLGGSDFLTFRDLIISGGISNGIHVFSNLFSGVRIYDSWFFNNKPWAIFIDCSEISDVYIKGNRFEGSSSPSYLLNNMNGVFATQSPKNHTTPQANGAVPIRISDNRFERIASHAVYLDGINGGASVKDNAISYGNVFLSHTVSGSIVKNNSFVDINAVVIDSGFGNDCTDNSYGDSYNPVVLTNNHGYNSIITDADNVDVGGAGGWTMPANTDRVYGKSPALGRLKRANSISITANATLTRALSVTAGKFYTIRTAWQVPPTTSKRTQGAKVVVLDGATTLFDSGAVVDAASCSGITSYDSWGFKTGAATTSINFNVVGLNSETTYWHLIDLALNICQHNPNMEDSWSSGLPNASWSKSGNITVSEYTADYHSGSKSLRVEMPATITATTSLSVDAGGALVHGQAYECEFWYKNLSGLQGDIISLTAGPAFIGSDTIGTASHVHYVPALSSHGWEKMVFQFVHTADHSNLIQLVRLPAGTFSGASDFLIDDFSIIPITM